MTSFVVCTKRELPICITAITSGFYKYANGRHYHQSQFGKAISKTIKDSSTDIIIQFVVLKQFVTIIVDFDILNCKIHVGYRIIYSLTLNIIHKLVFKNMICSKQNLKNKPVVTFFILEM